MATQERVSIVIPTFNDDPTHLQESVESALAQTHTNVEVILVDDGSNREDTRATVDALGQKDRVLVVRKANGGAASAMNAGVAAAKGDYVITLAGDDRINSDFVSSCLAVMAPDVAFCYSAIEYFWDDGSPSRFGSPPQELTLASFMSGNRVAAVGLVRRADWNAVGGLTSEDLAYEDYDLWVRLLRESDGLRAVDAPGAMLQYRQRPESRSSTRGPVQDRMRITRGLLSETDDPTVLRRMLLAAFERLDEMSGQLTARDAQLATWSRRTEPIRRLRSLIRH